MANGTIDIGEKEQLSIGLRFYDDSQDIIREKFISCVELKCQDVHTIANAFRVFQLIRTFEQRIVLESDLANVLQWLEKKEMYKPF